MKGEINPDHMPVNKFSFRVLGFIDLTVVELSGIEDELETVELPDRTMGTGGNRKAGEFELTIPMHHDLEFAAMEVWFLEGQDPVSPTYKKSATISHKSASGRAVRNFTVGGCFVKKRALPDLDKSNEGEMATVTYTMSYDNVTPL